MNFSPEGINKQNSEFNSSLSFFGKKAGLYFVRIILLAILAIMIALIFLGFGAYRGVIDASPDIEDVNIMPAGYATFVYDSDGNEMQKLNSADGNRISVSISDMPVDLQHAIVAIEDSRFYEHNGIDAHGMLRAVLVAVQSGFSRTEGASTITQQLLKNNVFTSWTSESKTERIKRKLQEQYLAVQLEQSLTESGEDAKSVILENYLNTVNFGAGSYGVQTASITYFGKDCKDLTLSECAVLAAIPQNPSKYNPLTHPENNIERAHIVLKYMLEQSYITQEEYDDALVDLDSDVYLRIAQHENTASTEDSVYSYFIDELISQVKSDLMDQKGYTEVQANNAIYSGGLQIYTTQDTNIQNIMDEEFTNEDNFPDRVTYALDWALTVDHANGVRENYSREMLQVYFRQTNDDFDLLFDSEEEAQQAIDDYKAAILTEGDTIVAERSSFTPQPQASMVVIDQSNGYVKGMVGGRGEKTASLTLNRATDSFRQPGSTFKPISTYGPALDTGAITLATSIEDSEYSYNSGQPVNNADNSYHGNVTVREAIKNSYNIPAVKTLTEITPQVGFDYLQRLGFKKLIDDTEWDVTQALALGGITNGVSSMELAAAYAAIANGGNYIEPILYTKITDHQGNVILENTSVETRVFKESTAYLLTSAMEDVITSGTGTDFRMDNMHLAGKTGTTNTYHDLVFAGFTPYYTAAIWAGCDVNVELESDYRHFHQNLYTTIMNRIHEDLPDMNFSMPTSVTKSTVCAKTGLLPGTGCTTITEYFDAATLPTARCTECMYGGSQQSEEEENSESERESYYDYDSESYYDYDSYNYDSYESYDYYDSYDYSDEE